MASHLVEGNLRHYVLWRWTSKTWAAGNGSNSRIARSYTRSLRWQGAVRRVRTNNDPVGIVAGLCRYGEVAGKGGACLQCNRLPALRRIKSALQVPSSTYLDS